MTAAGKDLSIADFFNIRVVREATKQVVKEELYEKLVDAGILAEGSEDNDGTKPQDVVADISAPAVFFGT